jgi:hypothetical protein
MAGVHLAHRVAAVVTRSACEIADLLGEQSPDALETSALKGLIETVIGCNLIDGIRDKGIYYRLPTEAVIE